MSAPQTVKPETLAMVAAYQARPTPPKRPHPGPDAIERQIEKAAPWLDAAPRPPGQVKPSRKLALRYVILMAHGERDYARQLVRDTLEEARSRWRAGFYATPYGPPVWRPLTEKSA